jgi:hypothetical protein
MKTVRSRLCDTVELPLFDQRRLLKALREHETFDLGERIVGGDVTHYWAKRLKSGRKWKVTWTVEKRVRVVGTFTSEEVLDYFRRMDVRTIPADDWVSMGWRPHDGDYGPVSTAPVVEWKCVLVRMPRRRFSLTLVNAVTGTHLDGSPAERLRDGVDVYAAAAELCRRHGCPLSNDDLPRIAGQIAKIDSVAADQFRQGPQLLEQRRKADRQREEADRQRAEAKRQAALEPFREAIQAYVAALTDVRMPLYGYKSVRVRNFMEGFVLRHGRLPTSKHRVGHLFFHDFSDLRRDDGVRTDRPLE